MKLVYFEGPPQVGLGAAGTFRLGEPKDVKGEKLAARILAKKSVRFFEEGKVPASVIKKFEKQQAAAKTAANKEG